MSTSPSSAPLDGVGSIKLKIGVLVGLSVVTAALVSELGSSAGVTVGLTLPVTLGIALAVTQWLARGMTAPLREMTTAAARMATGDYAQRVTATSADEVGRLARAFNTMAVDLATADEQRRHLVATVSHELRTPLAGQRLLLENLVDGVVQPDDDSLATALAQAERLSDLVSDLLDLARIDGGAGQLDLAPVDVRDLVDRAVAEAELDARPVRYDVHVIPGLTVMADGARLTQVVANLLDNAARHSPAGGTVTVHAVADGGQWSLTVSDEGPGIPAGSEEYVFTRFGSAGPDDGGGGTGLGLAIASWVCEMHGGTIAALPAAPGTTGARIRAVLPRTPVVRTAHHSPARPPLQEENTMSATPAPSPSPGATPSSSRPTGPVPTGTVQPRPASAVATLIDDVWPERGLTTAPVPLFASLAIGALAATVLPFRNIGSGALLVLLLGGGLVLSRSPRRTRPWTVVSTVLCLGLGSFLVLRDAEWLAVLALVVVGVLVTTALTDARRIVPMIAGAASWVFAAVRGLPLLSRTIAALSSHRLLWPLLRTVVISAVALVVFGGLFASGDAVFGTWVGHLVPDLAWDDLVFRAFLLVAVGGLVLTACYLALNPPRVERLELPKARPVARTWEWLVPLGLVIAVFAGFLVAQASAMWGGHAYLTEVTGLTYAEYVHQGFGQLTVATALTLAAIALTVRKAPQRTAQDRLLLRVVLGALCLLTLAVVASALFRMSVYQQAYGFTVMRVLVDAFEVWLGTVVVLVVVAGIRWSGWWLPRAALVSGAVMLLVIGFANPEAWVAERNIERYHATGKIDTSYLSSLSADAAPTIVAGLPEHLARCATWDWGHEPVPDDLLSWNLGRARAAEVDGAAAGTVQPVGCP
ncbi:DUF4173 domain-containing protein [Georgenia satyanarayanai]|uniref:DUF4153 domain-containing protein n=1 Tax=Georgenia satyanarayanai TaxID=860221 RepID=UPI002041F36E|nr:DUF4153 domain-containing protein [Georgenia satyanarayanai]MCM3659406.1 DUF4173 domain-containing protein [Georgenia satyanarayanai]